MSPHPYTGDQLVDPLPIGLSSGKTGYAFDDLFLQHALSAGHPEAPARLAEIEKRLRSSGLRDQLRPVPVHPAPLDAIRGIHSEEHARSVTALPMTGKIALRAVAACLGAVDEVLAGRLRNAFCPVRPPGHHAHDHGGNFDGPGRGEGFCFYGNAAVAAKYALDKHGLSRVLIADWDFHHGNGTEWAFYEDPRVLFFSTHDVNAYPGTGDPSRRGAGKKHGLNINVPLPRGAQDVDIEKAFGDILLPAAAAYKPELVIVSAGFDSRVDDPLGNFQVTDPGFARLTRTMMNLAAEYCGGKLVSILEGGYDPKGLARAVEAHVGTLVS